MPPLAILYDVHGNRPALAAVITEALGDAAVAELDSLPEQLLIEGIRACHASPVSDVRSFLPAPAPEDDELLAGAGERRVVFGHTPLQFRRRREDGTELINPGSVGMLLDGDPRAAYARGPERLRAGPGRQRRVLN